MPACLQHTQPVKHAEHGETGKRRKPRTCHLPASRHARPARHVKGCIVCAYTQPRITFQAAASEYCQPGIRMPPYHYHCNSPGAAAAVAGRLAGTCACTPGSAAAAPACPAAAAPRCR